MLLLMMMQGMELEIFPVCTHKASEESLKLRLAVLLERLSNKDGTKTSYFRLSPSPTELWNASQNPSNLQEKVDLLPAGLGDVWLG